MSADLESRLGNDFDSSSLLPLFASCDRGPIMVRTTESCCSLADEITSTGQQASRNFSISSYLHASPTLTLTISLATYTILASIPLFILVAAARRTRTQRLPVSHLFLRAITFAILLVLALAQVGIMVAGSLESVYRLNDMGLGGAVERARAGYALASVSWAVGRLAQRFDTSVAPDLHRESNIPHSCHIG